FEFAQSVAEQNCRIPAPAGTTVERDDLHVSSVSQDRMKERPYSLAGERPDATWFCASVPNGQRRRVISFQLDHLRVCRRPRKYCWSRVPRRHGSHPISSKPVSGPCDEMLQGPNHFRFADKLGATFSPLGLIGGQDAGRAAHSATPLATTAVNFDRFRAPLRNEGFQV